MNVNLHSKYMFLQNREPGFLIVGLGEIQSFWIKDSFLFTKFRDNSFVDSNFTNILHNQYYGRKRNTLVRAGSYCSIVPKLTISPIFISAILWYIVPVGIVCSIYVIYAKASIQERELVFQRGTAILKYVLPKVAVFVLTRVFVFCFVWALSLLLQAIFTQLANAATLDRNMFEHKWFPVPKPPRTREWYDTDESFAAYVESQKDAAVNAIQKAFPFIPSTVGEAIRNTNLISDNPIETQTRWRLWETSVQQINTSFYGPYSSIGRFLSYRYEIISIVDTMKMNIKNGESIRSQILDILNKIQAPSSNYINERNHLLPFEDVQSVFEFFKNYSISEVYSSTTDNKMKLFLKVSNLMNDYIPGKICNIAKAVSYLTNYGFSAQDLEMIMRNCVKNTPEDVIADRICDVVRQTHQTFQTINGMTLESAASMLAGIISKCSFPGPILLTVGKTTRAVGMTTPYVAITAAIATVFVLVIKRFTDHHR